MRKSRDPDAQVVAIGPAPTSGIGCTGLHANSILR